MSVKCAEFSSMVAGKSNKIFIRKASWEDKDLLFQWRNLPEIITLSRTGKGVEYSVHLSWLKNYFLSEKGVIFVINYLDHPVGQLRFDQLDANFIEVTIYLIPGKTGLSIGYHAFEQGLEFLKKEKIMPIIIVANVRRMNKPSIVFFKKLGFSLKEKIINDDMLSFHLMIK